VKERKAQIKTQVLEATASNRNYDGATENARHENAAQ